MGFSVPDLTFFAAINLTCKSQLRRERVMVSILMPDVWAISSDSTV
jgi:hypothetical protein